MSPDDRNIDLEWCQYHIRLLVDNIHTVLKGQNDAVEQAVICLLASGNLLIEDVPGVGKTTLAAAIAKSIGLDYRRIQFTSDILPSDIIGISIFDPKTEQFVFHKGPLFTNILLADEINRAEPRAQSALLEAMFERQVSVDGITYALPDPFVVIATQNPVDLSGTFPLPDSQLDRFLFRISMGYPDNDAERAILRAPAARPKISPVIKCEDIQKLILNAERVFASDEILNDIQKIAHATRRHAAISQGISTRAMLDLLAAARARALFHNRNFILPDDINALAGPTLAHRIHLSGHISDDPEQIIENICDENFR